LEQTIKGRYALPVNTARIYGPRTGVKNAPVRTGRTYGPYVRGVCTGSAYRP